MIVRRWLDEQGQVLLNLHQMGTLEAWYTLEDRFPELNPVGTFEEHGGLRFYLGSDEIKGGPYGTRVLTLGKSHADAGRVQRRIQAAAIRTRWVERDGALLQIARFSKITRVLKGGHQASGEVDVEFMPSQPYWLTEKRTLSFTGTQAVTVQGESRAHLKVSITAGGSAVTDPAIITDAGVTRWIGTVPAGQTLVIDGRPGRWTVTLNGQDAHLRLTGPQPYMEPGTGAVEVTGGTAQIEYWDGEVVPTLDGGETPPDGNVGVPKQTTVYVEGIAVPGIETA